MRALGRLGERVWAEWDELRHAAAVIGTVLLVSVRPRSWVRTVRRAFAQQIMVIGVEAIGFVCGVAVFVGITAVMHLVFWTRQAEQSQLLGRLLVGVVIRELSPVLISLMVIIRSGSVMATELGIMKIDGRVHALEAQGISPLLSLVLPRMLGATVSTFCLTIIFILVALVSGYVFAASTGKGSRDLLLLANSVSSAIRPKDVLAVISKSILPGLYTSASCCIGGLDVGESLTEVPQATQRALERSLVGLFVISTAVSLLTYLG